MMSLGDKVLALTAIVFIVALFALVEPWVAVVAAIVSLPLAATILLR